MRLQAFAVLALSCALAPLAAGQEAGTTSGRPLGRAIKPGQSTELPASAASVKPSDNVITVTGACKDGTQNGCVAAVSREEFEQMANAVKPGMTTDARRNFGLQYGKIIAYSDRARALGLEDDPRFKEILKFVKDQLLVEALNDHYSKEFENQPDVKIEAYYKENSRKYLEAELQRIIIPGQPAAAEITKPTEAEQKAYVDKIRQQWVAGADPATLQKEAFVRMGLTSSAPEVKLKDYSPAMLPPDQQGVFDMKPGEISQAFTDTAGSYIFKLVSKQEKPLSEVKVQIAKTLHDQMMRDKIQELSDTVKPELNEAYFGPEKKPEAPQTGALGSPQQGAPSSQKSGTPSPTSPQK